MIIDDLKREFQSCPSAVLEIVNLIVSTSCEWRRLLMQNDSIEPLDGDERFS